MHDLVGELALGLSGSYGSVERFDVGHISGEQFGVPTTVGRGRPVGNLQIWDIKRLESAPRSSASIPPLRCERGAGKLWSRTQKLLFFPHEILHETACKQ